MAFRGASLIKVLTAFYFLSVTDAWQYVTTRRVPSLGDGPVDLLDLVSKDIDYKYTDRQVGLTAIKDKKFKSCFIVDYDPYWTLHDHDKEAIVTTRDYKIEDLQSLERRAGLIIAHMCKRYKQFWLNQNGEPPKVDSNGSNPPREPDFKEPPPVEAQPPQILNIPQEMKEPPKYDDADKGATPMRPGANPNQSILGNLLKPPTKSPSNDGAPPMMPSSSVDQSGELAPPRRPPNSGNGPDMQGPPPLSEWLLNHPVNGPSLAGHDNRNQGNVEAPPPLSVWRQSHPVNNARSAPNRPPNQDDVETPPPIAIWQAQHHQPDTPQLEKLLAPPLHLAASEDKGMQAPPLLLGANEDKGMQAPPLLPGANEDKEMQAPPLLHPQSSGFEIKYPSPRR